MTFNFEVVTHDEGYFVRREYENEVELGEFYEIVGRQGVGRLREELVGKPVLNGLVGPMFGGFSNNGSHYTVRYESQAAYNLLSD